MIRLKYGAGCLLFPRTLIGLLSPFNPGTRYSVLKMAIVIFNSILFILLQMLQVAVIVPTTLTAFVFMFLMVVHFPMSSGLGIVPASLTGHVAANLNRFVFFDVVYFLSL